MIGVYIVPWTGERPKLAPGIDPEGGVQLYYQDSEGELHGGWSVIGEAPQQTVIVWVDTSPETHAALQADADVLLLMEEDPDGES